MTGAVQEHIIGPMLAIYPPPQHLRGDRRRQAEALAAYTKALARFDAPTLAAGWQKVVAEHPFWVWPNPGAIADACRACLPKPPAVSDGEQRRQAAEALADAYTARFMKTTQFAKLAEREGWAPRLREYVRDAAWVQAQLIEGVYPVGFPTNLIPRGERHRPLVETFAEYRGGVMGAVDRGRVRVSVPPDRIRGWKAASGKAAEPAPPPGPGR